MVPACCFVTTQSEYNIYTFLTTQSQHNLFLYILNIYLFTNEYSPKNVFFFMIKIENVFRRTMNFDNHEVNPHTCSGHNIRTHITNTVTLELSSYAGPYMKTLVSLLSLVLCWCWCWWCFSNYHQMRIAES